MPTTAELGATPSAILSAVNVRLFPAPLLAMVPPAVVVMFVAVRAIEPDPVLIAAELVMVPPAELPVMVSAPLDVVIAPLLVMLPPVASNETAPPPEPIVLVLVMLPVPPAVTVMLDPAVEARPASVTLPLLVV